MPYNKAANENEYRFLLNNASDAIFVADQAGQYVDVNKKACNLLGYTKKELLQINLKDLHLPKNIKQKPLQWDKVKKGKETLTERYLKKKDGSYVAVEISSKMLPNNRLLGIVRDISKRKRSEEILENLAIRFISLSGNEFYNKVCAHVAKVLHAEYAFVGLLSPDNKKVTVIGGIENGNKMHQIEYELANTPCDHVMGKKTCIFQSSIQKLFPKDILLADMKAESYAGIPLYSRAETPLGIFVIISKKPITEDKLVVSILTAYSEKLSTEIERSTAEEALAKSEDNYRTLMDQAADAIFVADKNGNYVDVNKKGCNLIGYSKEEILKLNIKDLLDPDEMKSKPPLFKELYQGKTIINERHLIRKDGSKVCIEISAKMLPDERLIAFKRDITYRKQAEEKLKQSEEKYRLLAESARDIIFIINNDKTVGYINNYGANLIGQKPTDIVGKKQHLLFSPSLAQNQEAKLQIVFETGLPMFSESKFLAQNEWLWLDTSLVPIKNDHGEVMSILGISRDITETKLLEELNQSLNKVNNKLNSSLNLDEMMKNTVKETTKALGCDSTIIALRQNNKWKIGYSYGLIEQIVPNITSMTMDSSQIKSATIVAGTRELLIVDDARKETIINQDSNKLFKIKSYIAAPIIIKESVIGIIYFIFHTKPVIFKIAQIDFAAKICNSISLAMNNARLFEAEQILSIELKMRDKLNKDLNNINKIIHSSLNYSLITKKVLKLASNALNCDSSFILIRKEKGFFIEQTYGAAQYKVGQNISDDGARIAALSAANRKTYIVNKAFENIYVNYEHIKKNNIHSILCTPLIINNKVFGVLAFHHNKAGSEFNTVQEYFANNLSTSLSLAIQNANLFEKIKIKAGVKQV